jgi:hypothetical protein
MALIVNLDLLEYLDMTMYSSIYEMAGTSKPMQSFVQRLDGPWKGHSVWMCNLQEDTTVNSASEFLQKIGAHLDTDTLAKVLHKVAELDSHTQMYSHSHLIRTVCKRVE